ncbi:Alpha/Beta hydrolase protein [Mycena floridula]|nr:Alpha/Beta hydrolase protein [Mycena floridula]
MTQFSSTATSTITEPNPSSAPGTLPQSSSSILDLLSQSYHTVPEFTLESGIKLTDVPVAYKTWGTLNENGDNVMVICHAFTGSADVGDWWSPLLGPSLAFDPTKYFIFCGNVLGSPYGTMSPITPSPYKGPLFPHTTIRDDVLLHKVVLDSIGVKSIAVAIGGSMGGMAILEWPLCFPGYVRRIIPIATSARHSAWCISWGEAQRQAIYSDPQWQDGWYQGEGPKSGLAAARMSALLTYRSRDSFEGRFGRKAQTGATTSPPSPSNRPASPPPPALFSAQSYLRYQGAKFTARFDANCYVHITHKLDSHDLSRGRMLPAETPDSSLVRLLGQLPPALVISIDTDGLFTPVEQRIIAEGIPQAELVIIESGDGHDGFLLEFESINRHVLAFLGREFPEYYAGDEEKEMEHGHFEVKQTSVFGEAEVGVDLARW